MNRISKLLPVAVMFISGMCLAQVPVPPSSQGLDVPSGTTPAPVVPPGDDVYVVHSNNPHTTPTVQHYAINEGRVRDIHLRFGITTTVKTPSAITTIAVGDPYLFEAEHSADEPTIVLIKPRTHDQTNSNMVVVLENGTTLSFRLLSVGDGNTGDAVDYMVDMQPRQSLFQGPSEIAGPSPTFTSAPSPNAGNATAADSDPQSLHNQLLRNLAEQRRIATPTYQNAKQLTKLVKQNENAPNTLALALGKVQQHGELMTVSYSVMNISNSFVEVLPPQVQYSNPHTKKPKKNRGARAEQLPIEGYLTTERKLAPNQRCDGVLTFTRPNYKQYEEKLLLQVAAAAAIDFPLMMPLPFVAPGQE
jgi:hypothetical protein